MACWEDIPGAGTPRPAICRVGNARVQPTEQLQHEVPNGVLLQGNIFLEYLAPGPLLLDVDDQTESDIADSDDTVETTDVVDEEIASDIVDEEIELDEYSAVKKGFNTEKMPGKSKKMLYSSAQDAE